jgi:hypothetical protein
MDCSCEPKFRGITDNIIKTEHNRCENSLRLYYKCDPERSIMNIIRYLRSTDWKNYKFNEYSVKKSDDNYVIIFNCVEPKLVFQK